MRLGWKRCIVGFLVSCLTLTGYVRGEHRSLPQADAATRGMQPERLQRIDDLVEDGLAKGEMTGCVVLVARHGTIVWLKAYGNRLTGDHHEAMATDTIFDMASITKPVATATSLMRLVEQNAIDLEAPVSNYLPEFGKQGKEAITVLQLLTHQGGLIPDNSLDDYQHGPDAAWQRICELTPQATPGREFIYSDVGFITLGKLIERVSHEPLQKFAQENIFGPLGMADTGFLPGEAQRARAAPTEVRDGQMLQGVVHDPRSALLGGVAGHAGLFSTAEDLAVFGQMMLQGGSYDGIEILKPETVRQMTGSYRIGDAQRGLGWDRKSSYSINAGDLLSSQAFGHGGFTGTVMWIDPAQDLIFIFLSSRLYPDGQGTVNPLAGRIATVAAAAIQDSNGTDTPGTHPVLTGIDVLQRDQFRSLQGRKVGLITNQTGVNRQRISTATLLHKASGVNLVALFSPEHGLQGALDIAKIPDSQDEATGLPVVSLYGESRRPTPERLKGIDTLVFDIQDIGTRYYTYVSTMGLAMEAAAELGIRFVVLDRPNPIRGDMVEGPMLDPGRESFVGFHSLPVRHGMTVGELAQMFRAERKLNVDLQVVRLEGWHRGDWFDRTELPWIAPSPNMRTLSAALLYPGIGWLETTNLSVGRGTDTPFEILGAPWIDEFQLARELNQADLPGIRCLPVQFVPSGSVYAKQRCHGVQFLVIDRNSCRPLHLGFAVTAWLRKNRADDWQADTLLRLLGNEEVVTSLLDRRPLPEIVNRYQSGREAFRQRRASYLLYE